MLPTPSTSHVSFNTVYEPAEDSFLLLDTLSSPSEKAWLQNRFSYAPFSNDEYVPRAVPLVLEVGTGSGVVIAFLAANAQAIFGRDVLAMGVDVNENACEATNVTVQKALAEQKSRSVYLGTICTDLCEILSPAELDVLVFNPPYVPTSELPLLPGRDAPTQSTHQYESNMLALSYAGGLDGMETTYRLLDQLPRVLSSRGVAYILLCAQNKPELVKAKINELLAGEWLVETVGRSGKTAGWEKLQIIRICRIS